MSFDDLRRSCAGSIKRLSWVAVAFVASSLLSASALAAPLLLFDSFDGGTLQTPRSAGLAPIAFITTVPQPIELTHIAVLNDFAGAGNLKFVVLDHATHAPVYISDAVFFGDDGGLATWKLSDEFSLWLDPALQYDIGAIADVTAYWAFDQTATAQNGFTSVTNNQNIEDFASPIAAGHGGADIAVRLYTVPEPNSLLLLGVGLLGLRRRGRVVF